MISKTSLMQIADKLYLTDLIESMNEFRKDNRGGFLIPLSVKITDEEYARYRHLPVNWSLTPITKEDLPHEFSPQAVKTVDMFRRKTIDLTIECMIYLDIDTGEIVYCQFSDENVPNEVTGLVYGELLKERHIASVHSHPRQYFSPHSGENFEMLGLEFEEYELIISLDELWILESNDVFDKETIMEIRYDVNKLFQFIYDDANSSFDKKFLLIDNLNQNYGDSLLKYLNEKFPNVKVERRNLHG